MATQGKNTRARPTQPTLKQTKSKSLILLSVSLVVTNSFSAANAEGGTEAPSYSVINVSEHDGSQLNLSSGNVVLDFGTSNSLNISSNFNVANGANVYVASSTANNIANISAINIAVGAGGQLSGILPDYLAGLFNTVSFLNLTASQSITNQGTIAAANLTMTAPQIINALPSVGGANPLIQALQTVNLNTANLVNAAPSSTNTSDTAGAHYERHRTNRQNPGRSYRDNGAAAAMPCAECAVVEQV